MASRAMRLRVVRCARIEKSPIGETGTARGGGGGGGAAAAAAAHGGGLREHRRAPGPTPRAPKKLLRDYLMQQEVQAPLGTEFANNCEVQARA